MVSRDCFTADMGPKENVPGDAGPGQGELREGNTDPAFEEWTESFPGEVDRHVKSSF